MELSYVDVLSNGERKTVTASVTTDQPASSAGKPVIVLPTGEALDLTSWLLLNYQIVTATPDEMDLLKRVQFINQSLIMSELGRKGGSSTSEAKKRSSAENGKKGGRPVSFKTAVKSLAAYPQKNRDKLIAAINDAVEPLCKTNTYNNEGSDAHTHLLNWLNTGDFTGEETPTSLATEWDELEDD